MRGEEEEKSPIVEIHKNITVEAEDPEQEVDKQERGNSMRSYSPVTGHRAV
jgi:hypothetical protein